jgi:hypothetical protein
LDFLDEAIKEIVSIEKYMYIRENNKRVNAESNKKESKVRQGGAQWCQKLTTLKIIAVVGSLCRATWKFGGLIGASN